MFLNQIQLVRTETVEDRIALNFVQFRQHFGIEFIGEDAEGKEGLAVN
jgi:hypothetical protein